jgi:hypothetical protein
MTNTPVSTLIADRCDELGLTRADLIRRAGYANMARGLRRLQALMNGDLDASKGLLAKLPKGLNLPPEMIAKAVEGSSRQIREAAENEYRASFKPHAIILTKRDIPQQITFALLTGAPRHLHIDFDLTRNRCTFIHQALSETRLRLHRFKGIIPFFGKAIGVVVNYAPERSVRYDLEGNAVELLKGAYRTGEAYLQIGARRASQEQAARLFSMGSNGS